MNYCIKMNDCNIMNDCVIINDCVKMLMDDCVMSLLLDVEQLDCHCVSSKEGFVD